MLNPPAPDGPASPPAAEPAQPAEQAEPAELSADIEDVRARTQAQLDAVRRTWLSDALAEAARAPRQAAWELYFASAGRHCGRTSACDVRVLLLHAAGAGEETLTRLYRQGTASERAAVLRALPHLPTGATPRALPLVEDALRANDTTLVAAAVGPYAAAWLDPHAWRHAVLKCLFTGVPLDAVSGLARRARGDAELARMLRDFARERTAAGRPVPADLDRALALTEPDAPADPPEEN
ncbi:hypothetical protein K378_02011 [Streptomyces sp. Amel2xB2]|uniref:EboA domain-containing protein n=1 Tax=Streptomyces sp. Amel2xB2 TaxID=1305829 RepID=UPI000DB9D5D6|nr:EboA domain-containing protein [Streptomyces sp. Amel2xB2]RAJ69121.1 hypothetical protein K378_02011 [Streptomyces sp. Amel2xB2]